MSDDYIGKRYGMWTIQSFSHKKNYDKYYNCICDCGTEKKILINNLKRGLTKSCGCNKGAVTHDRCFIDLTGNKYNNLTCIRWERKNGCIYWLCKCDCGNETWVKPANLKSNAVKSCGCLLSNSKSIHGMSHTRLHGIWSKMIERCRNSNDRNYKWYGERGISVCNEWLGTQGFINFMNWSFKNGYNDKLSIDRINNNEGYSPDNCRWTDKITQANNTRSNIYVTCNNETHTIAEWSRITGINYSKLSQRISILNWDVAEALGYKEHKRKEIKRDEKGRIVCLG